MFKSILRTTISRTKSLTRHRTLMPYFQINKKLHMKFDSNLTAVLKDTDELVLEQRPLPKVNYGDVIIAIDCVSIGADDVHNWQRNQIDSSITKKRALVIGHEASGVVVFISSNGVQNLKIGDRVAIEPGIPCRLCNLCKHGLYNLCPKLRYCGTSPIDGNLTQFFRHAADFCHKLPDHVTMEEGALLESIAWGVAACRRARLQLGMNVLIEGADAIGLATLLVAKQLGANKIFVIDTNSERLELAKALGATDVLCVNNAEQSKIIAESVIESMGCMPDITIDCCGTQQSVELGVYCTRSGGVCCCVNRYDDVKLKIPLNEALARQVDIVGVLRYCNDYPKAISLASSGSLELKKLIKEHFMLLDINDAFKSVIEGNTDSIKTIIHVQKLNTNNPVPFNYESNVSE